MSKYSDIIERLEKADGTHDYLFCRDIHNAIDIKGPTWSAYGAPRYLSSLDAAIALVERAMPGAVWHVMTDYGGLQRAKIGPKGRPSATIYDDDERPNFTQADAETPTIALLIALFRALEAA